VEKEFEKVCEANGKESKALQEMTVEQVFEMVGCNPLSCIYKKYVELDWLETEIAALDKKRDAANGSSHW
jgi:hypothetical protein